MPTYSFRTDGIVTNDYPLKPTGAATILNAAGTGASGTATCFMPIQGDYMKMVIVYLNNFKHISGTLEYTFPVAFSATPYAIDPTTLGATITATKITFPTSMASAKTGWLILMGW
ncbi:MAG: hypothetical protein QXV73_03915 [Candidatus Micrarchaeia archaeon]